MDQATSAPGTGDFAQAELTVPADVRYLVLIRRFIHEAAQVLGAVTKPIDDLVQAADELATNTILHGYRGQPGWIEVAVRPAGGDLLVILRDQAPPFDPTLVPEPDLSLPLERRPVGGLGVYLSRKLTDEIRHHALPAGGNEVILVKRGVRAAK